MLRHCPGCRQTLVCDKVEEAKRLAFNGEERMKVLAFSFPTVSCCVGWLVLNARPSAAKCASRCSCAVAPSASSRVWGRAQAPGFEQHMSGHSSPPQSSGHFTWGTTPRQSTRSAPSCRHAPNLAQCCRQMLEPHLGVPLFWQQGLQPVEPLCPHWITSSASPCAQRHPRVMLPVNPKKILKKFSKKKTKSKRIQPSPLIAASGGCHVRINGADGAGFCRWWLWMAPSLQRRATSRGGPPRAWRPMPGALTTALCSSSSRCRLRSGLLL